MANRKSSGGNPDPRDAFDKVREQLFESFNKSFNDALGMLQEVTSTIEQRLEDVFGSTPGSRAGAQSNVRDTTATRASPNKPTTTTEENTNTTTKKAPVAQAKAKKKAAASKKPAAKKKAAAKKAPAKKLSLIHISEPTRPY